MKYRVLVNEKSELEGSLTVGCFDKLSTAIATAYQLAKDYYNKWESANIYVCEVLNDNYDIMSYKLTYSVYIDNECRAIFKYLRLSEYQERLHFEWR